MYKFLLFAILSLVYSPSKEDLKLGKYTEEEFCERLREQYNVIVNIDMKYTLEVLPEWVNWSRRRFDYGYPIALYNGLLKRKDASCIVLFGPTPDKTGARTPLRTEMFDVLEKDYEYPERREGDNTTYIANPVIPDSFKESDYYSSFRTRKKDTFNVRYFRVPDNSSSFFLKGYDDQVSSLQALRENEYPTVYRVFFFKEGKQIFDVILLLSSKASRKPEKYIKEINGLFTSGTGN